MSITTVVPLLGGGDQPDLDVGPRYVPILKARQGEMRALTELVEPVGEDVTPLIELVDGDFESLESDDDIDAEVARLVGKVVKAWGPGRPRVIVDTVNVEVDTETPIFEPHGDFSIPDPVTPRILEQLREVYQIRAVPVIRLSDQSRYVVEVAAVLARSGGEPGACLRIGAEDLDDEIVPLDVAIERLLERYAIDPPDVDLVLDFGAITDDEAMTLSARVARFVLPTLDRQPWRSFVLAAGAFPADLSEVAAFSITPIPRRDKQLWQRLSLVELRRDLDYGDYAVTHPRLQTGVAFAAPPQIRYTTDEAWLVTKGRRTDRRGHRQFFDLCGRLRDEHPDDIAPAQQSWGDERFHEAADKDGSDEDGPGNASTWRAIATSHHIAMVRRGLSVRHEP